MANTVIQLKKSATPSATPSSLANGELAINFADGKLFYKAANGTIVEFSSGSAGNDFGTVNANGTLIVSDTNGDVFTLAPGDNINIVGDAINDVITISANLLSALITANAAYNQANTARTHANNAYNIANLAFDKANTSAGGGAYFQGNNGDVGSVSGLGDIFRVHTNTLNANVTIYSGNNALAAGPITIATGKTLTIQNNARVAIV